MSTVNKPTTDKTKSSCARFMPGTLTGIFLSVVLITNTLMFGVPLVLACLLRVVAKLLGIASLVDVARQGILWVASTWMRVNLWFVRTFVAIDWDIRVDADLDPGNSYLITSNHQSWVDIMALYESLIHEIAFLRFFIKDQLKYIPILGLAWWGLDFPFMKRHSAEFLAKHPELKGQDLETTKKSCEQYRGQPVAILNFLEGTRFSKSLHAKQQSPYQYLLTPKAGGLAFAVGAMGDQLHSLLSITIAYPKGVGELWAFLCGRIHAISVRVHEHEIPASFLAGGYQTDETYRAEFKGWVSDLWSQKDQELALLMEQRAKQ